MRGNKARLRAWRRSELAVILIKKIEKVRAEAVNKSQLRRYGNGCTVERVREK